MIAGIGQDSHRFGEENKPFVLGGVHIEGVCGMDADSDGDVVLHSLCNAISSITHVPILGGVAIEMCKQGITDSVAYVEKALATLGDKKIRHIAFTVEGKRPKMQRHAEAVRENVARLCGISASAVGFTCTSGDHLTRFADGDGLQCFCIISVDIE